MGYADGGHGHNQNKNNSHFDNYMDMKMSGIGTSSDENAESAFRGGRKKADGNQNGKIVYDASKDSTRAVIIKCFSVTALCMASVIFPIVLEMNYLLRAVFAFAGVFLSVLIFKISK